MSAVAENANERAPSDFLKIQDLTLNFRVYDGLVRVLDHIDIEMKEGEILGIVGETGCGKTVASRSIVRLFEPNAVLESGTINFKGSDNLLALSEKELESFRGRRVSIIFQEPMTSLNPTMRIDDQIGESLILHFKEDMIKKAIELKEGGILSGLYQNLLKTELNSPNSTTLKIAKRIPIIKDYQNAIRYAARKETINILESVEMPSPTTVAAMHPHELSGGMRQRILIAIAIACEPELIIADEPTTAVDATTQAKLLNLLLKLREEHGTSILLITHNLGVIAEISDRVCVMYAGQICEIGEVADIFHHPLHPYTKGLMGAIHQIGDNRKVQEIKGDVPILLNPPTGCRFHPRCPRAMEICSNKKPTLLPVEEGHQVHCWLYQKEGND